MYDWANSAFAAIIQTFVFAAYFTGSVAVNDAMGTAQWGFTASIAGIFVALGSPFLGAIADHSGHRKKWVIALTIICVIATGLLWTIKPSPEYVTGALVLVGIAIIASEYSYIFYNSMLPGLAPPEMIGRWSGWGWSMGYAGGTVSLLIALFLVYQGPDLLGLDASQAQPIRATTLLTAAWLLLFALPLFFFTPEVSTSKKPFLQAVTDGLKQLKTTISNIHQYSQIARLLAAHLFYLDALSTLFVFGGVYAASVFQMSAKEIIAFGIALNIVSGLGAWFFAFVDDRLGSKKTIIIGLINLLVFISLVLLAPTKTLFWIAALFAGIFVGPVQASTRSYLARISPPHLQVQMFGFLSLSGRCTAFLGPALVGWATYISGDERIGMTPILALLTIGFLILLTTPKDK
ncbi:MAG: MFS transporter [Chlamydiales bacterium]|nr:MFS transporter [Chlamydiales bacterium]